MVAACLAALLADTGTLTHLIETVLPRYALNTLALILLVGLGTFVIGVSSAFLVVMTEFPGRRFIEIALVLPLALPAYVLAYAYTHILDHPGIVQTVLRDLTGWGPRDYWFPEIRSLGGAAAMLIIVLYPYVYLLTRAALLGQSASYFSAARSLGDSPVRIVRTIYLPLVRPAIAGGLLLATMETLADFGTVAYFGVQTFATGIYTSWFSMADRGAAAQLAVGLLAIALLIAGLERFSRRAARYDTGRRRQDLPRFELRGNTRWLALGFLAVPLALGVVIPVVSLFNMALTSEQDLLSDRYLGFIRNSFTLALIAALVTVTAAVLLGSLHRFMPGRLALGALYAGRLGYAVPGGVIAVGLLVPFAAFDNALDAWMRANFDLSTGLLITGSIWLLVGAYTIRFLAAALGAYEGGMANISPNMDAAARILGRDAAGAIWQVHLPLLRPSLLTAFLIVFVDVMKELPATLIMRPFNFDTLAVQAHRLAADERLEGAAVPSLVIVVIGILPLILLIRSMTAERPAARSPA
ncbi:MAG: iron ABC transporter permease [Pseudomonadota bacterium]